MSEARFTPGPWFVEDPFGNGPDDDLWIVTEVEGGKVYNWRVIAQVGTDCGAESDQPPINVKQRDATARLIAAAPDLFEALDELMKAVGVAAPDPVHFRARAALAKARGES